MDILSHGLYGSIAFGRRNRRNFWIAFFFGIAPDFFSFGLFFIQRLFEWETGGVIQNGPPDPSTIPAYVGSLYNVTHSLVVFAVVFAVVWFIQHLFARKQIGAGFICRIPFMPMLAWPLHILVDIPTHGSQFFPTPFLWPVSDFYINGISWGSPYIFIPNVILITVLYIWYFFYSSRARAKRMAKLAQKSGLI
ncbi:MAG: metal-dependent hydrolase [bacterium]|nr:metal-dependent hydrolase [bacterium]